MRTLALFALTLSLAAPAAAPAQTTLHLADQLQWRANANGGQLDLYYGGVQIGAIRYADGTYLRLRNGQWDLTPVPPPIPVPAWLQTVQGKGDFRTHGINATNISATEKVTVQGRDVTGEYRDLVGADVPDDSGLPRLTIGGGTDEERRKVEDDLRTHPALAPYRDAVVVKAFDARHWALTTQGLTAEKGKLTLFYQAPGGREIWTERGGYPGPEKLAEGLGQYEGLRRVRDDYSMQRSRGISNKITDGILEYVVIAFVALAALVAVVVTVIVAVIFGAKSDPAGGPQ